MWHVQCGMHAQYGMYNAGRQSAAAMSCTYSQRQLPSCLSVAKAHPGLVCSDRSNVFGWDHYYGCQWHGINTSVNWNWDWYWHWQYIPTLVCCTQANISTLARATETACAGHQANESQSWWICNTWGAQPSMGRWDWRNCICISACKSKCKNAVTQECSRQKSRAVWCVRQHCKSCCLLQRCHCAISKCSMRQLATRRFKWRVQHLFSETAFLQLHAAFLVAWHYCCRRQRLLQCPLLPKHLLLICKLNAVARRSFAWWAACVHVQAAPTAKLVFDMSPHCCYIEVGQTYHCATLLKYCVHAGHELISDNISSIFEFFQSQWTTLPHDQHCVRNKHCMAPRLWEEMLRLRLVLENYCRFPFLWIVGFWNTPPSMHWSAVIAVVIARRAWSSVDHPCYGIKLSILVAASQVVLLASIGHACNSTVVTQPGIL